MTALGGFSVAIFYIITLLANGLVIFALFMAWESVQRMIFPVAIAFNRAIFVAVLSLIVNGVSVFILGHQHDEAEPDQHHSHLFHEH